ncbi:MAG: DUF2723 domain-containing protein [Muribaculum sp.]|nr:DUF2723 domain-containing protein [Muribaculaceae bacterium]MCM1081665.1 DUF2723 domain-containing protein [Muribaculum sp.]
MKRYSVLNNSLGWLMFIIAAATYLLTLEPTASFWDCPEFISQGYKLEIGHPPGNPIFMLAARFFVNFAPGPEYIAIAVNSMSALLSAATILLLFWTITHLVRRLLVDDNATTVTPLQMLIIFASGVCGSLMYTWSDTFWFSAVEGEVYAFSSFCTALVFWLILKWEDRADQPHSDRYLVLIAYIIGISIAVHLLNLLCIPAIVLVFYYRKFKNTNAKGSFAALLVSFLIVGLILYGLVPGFIEMAQYCELLCVNVFHMNYNSGALIYAIVTLGVMIWAIVELYRQSNARRIKLAFFLSVFLSGIPFIGDNLFVPVVLSCALLYYLFVRLKKVPIRIFNVIILSILFIFIGYSSYALLLIRSSANTPMNQNAPNNVFSLGSYLNREQYGDRPLFYGNTFNSGIVYKVDASGVPHAIRHDGKNIYGKAVKQSPDEPDRYIVTGQKYSYEMSPELNMLFPRMYEGRYAQEYRDWTGMTGVPVQVTTYVDADGNPLPTDKQTKIKPTMLENLRFFFNYQLNHMYWRYFLWNFAGRQNDIAGNGELTHGNWISGIPFIDNPRLGPQELLPDDLGKGNKGHNVFFMLPLIMGILGIGWQAFTSKRGIEQFWVVAFLFFMTGIAIVIYLNQTPNQPRERDYAFAGSFYAYAIWVGMGVAAIWRALLAMSAKKKIDDNSPASKAYAAVAAVIGLLVPLQVVSQTWDDHDRSGRYAARDFGMNYLTSLDENAIVFTNGDNDTFPLWYAQEVEGYRTDVRVVNLSYLTTDWYNDQMRVPSYNADAIDVLASPADYANDALQFAYIINPDTTAVNALSALKALYRPDSKNTTFNLREMRYPNMYIPLSSDDMVAQGRITQQQVPQLAPALPLNMTDDPEGGLRLSKTAAIDMMATNAANGWKRPFYFAMTVPDDFYLGLSPYMQLTGMTYEVTGLRNGSDNPGVNTDKAYENIKKFRWGGIDKNPENIYLDETVRRMVTSTRSAMLDVATELYNEGITANIYYLQDSASLTPQQRADVEKMINTKYDRSKEILDLIVEKLPASAAPYGVAIGLPMADLYSRLAEVTGSEQTRQQALNLINDEINLYKGYLLYIQSLTPQQFNMLTRTDRYIYDTFFLQLLQMYGAIAGEADFNKLVADLQAQGVNLARYTKSAEK